MTATRKGKATAANKVKAEGRARRSAAAPKVATAKMPRAAAKPKSQAKSKATAGKKPAAQTPVVSESRAAATQKAAAKKGVATAPSAAATAVPSWQPRVVVFACNWCSYAGADTAGVSRIQQQPNFRMIRVMCSGRIQPAFVLRAFEKGADGVLVSGCHFGDCHYIFGNERAVEQFDKTMNMVKLLGIEPGRLRLEWISAAEGARFAQVINGFTDQVRKLGPSPFSRPETQTKLADGREEVA
jgi:F420-non-reducing hydrogenase iron-sulfur subunit